MAHSGNGANSMKESTMLREELYPIIDEIHQENPLISLEKLAAKVKERTGKGCLTTVRVRYYFNRRRR